MTPELIGFIGWFFLVFFFGALLGGWIGFTYGVKSVVWLMERERGGKLSKDEFMDIIKGRM